MDVGTLAAVVVDNSSDKKVKRFPDAALGFSGACKANREAGPPPLSLGFMSQQG